MCFYKKYQTIFLLITLILPTEIEEFLASMSGHQILARVTQPGIDGLSKRIFWLAQSVNSDLIQGERGLNVFSLYQLSVLRSQLDSGLSLDTSQFRDQTTHVANIWDCDPALLLCWTSTTQQCSNCSLLLSHLVYAAAP